MNVSVLIKSSKRTRTPGDVFLLSGRRSVGMEPSFCRPSAPSSARWASVPTPGTFAAGPRAAVRRDGGRCCAAMPAGLTQSRGSCRDGGRLLVPLPGSAGDVGVPGGCRALGELCVRLTSELCPWEMPSPTALPASPVTFGSRHGETFGAAQLQRTP